LYNLAVFLQDVDILWFNQVPLTNSFLVLGLVFFFYGFWFTVLSLDLGCP